MDNTKENHQRIRESLALAAVSALDAAEQAQVEAHLQSCEVCRRDFDALRGLASELRVLPPPVPVFGLAQRTSARVKAETAARAERRRHNFVLMMLIIFAWIDMLVIWAVARMFSDDLARLLHLSSPQLTYGLVAYWLFAVTATFALTAKIGRIHRHRRLV